MSFRVFMNTWVKHEVYPIVAAVSVACGAAVFFGARSISHSEVTFNPANRNDFVTSNRHNKLFTKEQCMEFQRKIQNNGVIDPDTDL